MRISIHDWASVSALERATNRADRVCWIPSGFGVAAALRMVSGAPDRFSRARTMADFDLSGVRRAEWATVIS
jgi:hypothetical protein